MNIVTPTEIQEHAIPKFLNSKDSHILAQAKTGSGKTLAFAIPIAQLLDINLKAVQSLIIVPTRELCKQVAEVFMDLAKYKRIKVVQVYGGVSIENQIHKIREGAQIVVATPGRLIDIHDRGYLSFKDVRFVALDEADRCLDMGFIPDIEYILLKAMKNVHPRLMLFSATLFHEVVKLVRKFTHGKEIIQIDVSRDRLTVENCDQYYYLIENFRDKYYHFVRILKQERPKHCIIFVNTKKTGDWLFTRLREEDKVRLQIELISGNLTQKRRENVLAKFRSKKINCLIATDVAARGLDIDKVSHVFNYDLPQFEENYIHRIGRTARVSGKEGNFENGTAITLVMKDQIRIMSRIEGIVNRRIRRRTLPPRYNQNNGRRPPRERQKEVQERRRNFLY
jgi:ATP-dependent RNA helicase DeaD